MRSAILFAILALSTTQAHSADCLEDTLFGRGCLPPAGGDLANGWQDLVDGARKVGTQIKPMDIIKAAFPTAPLMIEAVSNSGIPYLNSAAQNVAAIGTKLDKETQTAITNALTNPSKAIRDAAQTTLKAANDTVDAVEATARYAERTVNGNIEILDDAQARLREGKVIDAVWHLGTDRLGLENDNAAKLMQESEIARQVAQQAAAAYGGPAGAAAFAAWLTYNSSKGDFEKALLAGMYTYVVSTGNAKANAMPSGTVDEVVKKAATVAAVRGVAVAAYGGNQKEIMNAIVQSGGSVIVQSGQAYMTKKYVDPAKARADAFCIDHVNETCADAMQWVDAAEERAEQYKKIANTSPTVVVSGDGQWAISWNKETLVSRASKAPGVVLTYVGQGSYYRQQMLSFRKISKGDIGGSGQTKKPPTQVKATPRLHEVTIASNGLWIDDTNFPMGRSYLNEIEFYIDGEYEDQMYLHNPMDTMSIDLAEGEHVFTFSVRVRSALGGWIKQDCATKFMVSGVELYNPYIKFDRVDRVRGTVAKCALVRR
ncbi:hypothetical protein NKY66_11175 [Sinorhizobium meliloti]|uniref:hypothetical protein n=1 Tax=Rhizobium meliloti TaxID=382 RepID=UPI003D656A11